MPGAVSEPEWPPHPARLHAALVAAGWAIGGGERFPDDAYDALTWLERQPAPALACPDDVGRRAAPDVYVPRNLTAAESRDVLNAIQAGRNSSRQSGRISRRFPTSVPGDEPIWFVWNAESSTHLPALERLAREVQYLGSSRSPVCCDIVAGNAATTNFVPGSGAGSSSLRVAIAGCTDSLLASRHVHPPPAFGRFAPYGRTATPAATTRHSTRGPFADLAIRSFDKGFPYTILHASKIARAFREAVLANAGDGAPAILHGHSCNPHSAFLALANVGHAHASGQIVGAAVAIPRSATDAERAQIIAAVNAVSELRNLGSVAWKMRPGSERTLLALAPHRWTGPARTWQTVTPLILMHTRKAAAMSHLRTLCVRHLQMLGYQANLSTWTGRRSHGSQPLCQRRHTRTASCRMDSACTWRSRSTSHSWARCSWAGVATSASDCLLP